MWKLIGALLEEGDLRLPNQWLLSESTRSKRQMKIDPYQTQRKRRMRMPKEKYLSMKKCITTKDKTKWKKKKNDQKIKSINLICRSNRPNFLYYIKIEMKLEFSQIQISF